MLLTLAHNSVKLLLADRDVPASQLVDLPRYCMDHLGLRGLHIPTSLLAGWSPRDIDHLRDRADKSGCPCLLLVEEQPLPLASSNGEKVDAAIERVGRLVRASHRLGSNSIAVGVTANNSDEQLTHAVDGCKAAMEIAERFEVNILLAPQPGLTEDPLQLTRLIKKVSGFRIGTFPDYLTANNQPDPVAYMRRLTPYTGSVNAGFRETGGNLTQLTQAVLSVGFSGAIGLDYRGDGAIVEQITEARDILEAVIQQHFTRKPSG
ncbi:MAG: hypothetical protein KAS72_13935 [Phycisphaerales bacterium]|nr:hypothetical protein [Phycisphaerales bacterium]